MREYTDLEDQPVVKSRAIDIICDNENMAAIERSQRYMKCNNCNYISFVVTTLIVTMTICCLYMNCSQSVYNTECNYNNTTISFKQNIKSNNKFQIITCIITLLLYYYMPCVSYKNKVISKLVFLLILLSDVILNLIVGCDIYLTYYILSKICNNTSDLNNNKLYISYYFTVCGVSALYLIKNLIEITKN